MNSLNRAIKVGEVVVVAARYVGDEHKDIPQRLFRCESNGSGMYPSTNGKAIYGKWAADDTKDRIEGYMIDPTETEQYQKLHP